MAAISAFYTNTYLLFSNRFLALNPIIVENFCDSNIDEYYNFIFWGLFYGTLLGVSTNIMWSELGELDNAVINKHNGFHPDSASWYTLNWENRVRRLDEWTMSLVYSHECLWANVLGSIRESNVQFLIEIPARLATDGFLIDIVADLTSADTSTIAFAVMRLVMFYGARYNNLENNDELLFFLQKCSINFSPEANEYLSAWSQNNLLLHFNTNYSEDAYNPLDYFNPIIEVSQIWLMSYELPFLLNDG